MSELTDGQIARRALEILGEGGENWSRGRSHPRRPDGTHSHCLVGALGLAAGHWDIAPCIWMNHLPVSLRAALVRVVEEHYPDWVPPRGCYPWAADFNDDPEHTFDDIRLLLEKVAADG